MDCSLPGSSVHGIFQARVLEWGAIAFSRGIVNIVINEEIESWLKGLAHTHLARTATKILSLVCLAEAPSFLHVFLPQVVTPGLMVSLVQLLL